MVQKSLNHMLSLSMEDDLGIVYVIETAQHFWSELEDTIRLPNDHVQTLSLLDSALRRFLALCATYHEQYLQSPLQLEHAFNLIMDSELFQFHSERMCENMVEDAQRSTDPHSLFIVFRLLYFYGHRRPDFFRNHKRWQPLLPLLMDHVLVEMDPDTEDTYFGTTGSRNSVITVPVPIEAKLRTLGVKLLYEVCKVQKLSVQDLRIFDDSFIDYLFDLVEQTRYMHDDNFNYSVIKLIVALNEQFMVASLGNDSSRPDTSKATAPTEPTNRVIRVLMRRLGSSKTFGENMIFMLNRANHTAEDLCMQLLILKILYVLFTTTGLSEYFYTNDLCVLVDVFIRELADLDDDNESLRHTYLRVLHPLLTKTQLRDIPYKRPQIVAQLESLIRNPNIREVNPTTKRLVERCLSGDWCVQLKAQRQRSGSTLEVPASPTSDTSTVFSPSGQFGSMPLTASDHVDDVGGSSRLKSMKFSKSVENLRARQEPSWHPMPRSPLDQVRYPNNNSATSLPIVQAVPSANSRPPSPSIPKRRMTSSTFDGPHSPRYPSALSPIHSTDSEQHLAHHHHQVSTHPSSTNISLPTQVDKITMQAQIRSRRPPPPAPPKRRKPPAIPIMHANGVTIHPIRSSELSPLSRAVKASTAS